MGRVRVGAAPGVIGIERAAQCVALATPAAGHSVRPLRDSVLLSRASDAQDPPVERKSPNALAVPAGFFQIATITNKAAIQSRALPQVISSVLRIVCLFPLGGKSRGKFYRCDSDLFNDEMDRDQFGEAPYEA